MMKNIMVVSAILSVILLLAYCTLNNKQQDARGPLYAGSLTCIKCHSNQYTSYLHTAHYIASVPASLKTVHGNFSEGFNVFEMNSSEKVLMEKRESGLYQSFYLNNKLKESQRIDIVLGGIKGESYLYWKGNGLNQLPVSYYASQNEWLMSPGYAPGHVSFNRTITRRCMECHASYIGDQTGTEQSFKEAEQFDKSTLITSVDCERCHGPAAQHVAFQADNPTIKTAMYITRYNSLSRERRIDMCAVCHSGNKSQMLRSTFSFKPGDTLSRYQLPGFEAAGNNVAGLDVHGNQAQLLKSSKCYMASKMDCATCHNTHQNQRGNTAVFTQKCLSCHKTVNHKMANTVNAQIFATNCIQCHMPALPSSVIVAPTTAKAISADILVHTHRIAIYPEQAKKILSMQGK